MSRVSPLIQALKYSHISFGIRLDIRDPALCVRHCANANFAIGKSSREIKAKFEGLL
jgi:hypothetical protein